MNIFENKEFKNVLWNDNSICTLYKSCASNTTILLSLFIKKKFKKFCLFKIKSGTDTDYEMQQYTNSLMFSLNMTANIYSEIHFLKIQA